MITENRLRPSSRLAVLAWMAAYVVALLWSLETLIAPSFAYYGYEARDSSLLDVLVGSAATVVVTLTLAPIGRRPSDVAQLFLVLTTGIPVIWTSVLYGPLRSDQVQNLLIAVAMGFTVIALCLRGIRYRIWLLRPSRFTFWIWVGGFVLVAILLLLASGVTPQLTGFGDVYDQRQQYRVNVSVIGSYLVGWLAGGTFPLVMAVGLYRKSASLFVIAVVGVALLYAFTGYKSYAIGVGVVVGAYVMTRGGRAVSWHWISLLTAMVLAVGVLDLLRGTFTLTSLLVRRALTTAGINTAYYIDLFDGEPKYQLRHSVLSSLGEAPYDSNPAALVGSTYYLESTSANANFMADGFANFGWVGIIAASLVVGMLLRLYDKVSASLPLGVSAPALVFVLLALANTAVLTVLMTHGALVLLGWVSLMPLAVVVARRRASRDSVDGSQGRTSLEHAPSAVR